MSPSSPPRWLALLMCSFSCAMGAAVLQPAAQSILPWFMNALGSVQMPHVFGTPPPHTVDAQTLVQTGTHLKLPPPMFQSAVQSSVVSGVKVVTSFPHDRQAFTQGLFIHKGVMFESTGLHGQSSIRKVEIGTGKVTQMSKFDSKIFAEGITMHSDGKIYGLSWQEGLAFRIDPATLMIEKQFNYPFSEGWGITSDGTNLIITDSTQTIHFVDTNFKPVRSIIAHDPTQHKDIPYINELEYVNGKIYGNVYGLDHIAVIDPEDGKVTKWIDCRGLMSSNQRDYNEVFNGIAYDSDHKKLYVTGKNWPTMFQIEVL